MSQNFYGLTDFKELENHILHVVACFGGGSNAISLLFGTCAAETNLGKTRDIHSESGFGLCQFDKIAVEDVIARTRQHNKDIVEEHFGIDIDSVTPGMLDCSPLLSLIFCRLFYMLIPEPIPGDIEGRAAYWKKHYNKTGKGSIEHYLDSAEQLGKIHLYNALNY